MLYTVHANNFYTRKRFISNNEIYEKVMKTYGVQFLFFVFVSVKFKSYFLFCLAAKIKEKGIYVHIYIY